MKGFKEKSVSSPEMTWHLQAEVSIQQNSCLETYKKQRRNGTALIPLMETRADMLGVYHLTGSPWKSVDYFIL